MNCLVSKCTFSNVTDTIFLHWITSELQLLRWRPWQLNIYYVLNHVNTLPVRHNEAIAMNMYSSILLCKLAYCNKNQYKLNFHDGGQYGSQQWRQAECAFYLLINKLEWFFPQNHHRVRQKHILLSICAQRCSISRWRPINLSCIVTHAITKKSSNNCL